MNFLDVTFRDLDLADKEAWPHYFDSTLADVESGMETKTCSGKHQEQSLE